ncbi:MAG: SDR family oxidoreductase [Pseudomonadota bacterium]
MPSLLITGASSGIGAATAEAAVAAGYRLALAARSKDKLEALVERLGADNAAAYGCDVGDADSVRETIDAAAAAMDGLDAVFANAGIGASAAGTENGDPDNWRQMILTNTLGVALTAKFAIPHLKSSKGHLIVTGSVAGRRNFGGSIYGATKWFVHGYVGNLRDELSGTGIRITQIAPGMVDTPFFNEAKPKALRPEDIARSVIYALEQPPNVTVGDVLVLPTPSDN